MNITVNPTDNTLRFAFRELADREHRSRRTTRRAVIDIAREGRLLGLEIDLSTGRREPLNWPPEADKLITIEPQHATCYLAIDQDQEADDLTRSVRGDIQLVTDEHNTIAEIILPRRGEGYEITYPSGNR